LLAGSSPGQRRTRSGAGRGGREAKAAIAATTDAHLTTTNWKLLVGGHVVSEQPRYVFLRDTLSRLAHHRGQLTVHLRLLGVKVPSLYGLSADEQRFDSP
jgi:hypothetical protein